jgi:hypothetical protein
MAQGQNVASSLTAGYHETFLIGAVLAMLGLLITVIVLWAPAREVVRSQSESLDRAGDLERLEVMAGEF